MCSHKRLLHTGIQSYDHVELDGGKVFFAQALQGNTCPCCSVALRAFKHELPSTPLEPGYGQLKSLNVEICPICGWWHFHQESEHQDTNGAFLRAIWWELTHAIQSQIDLRSATLSIEQLQRHLVRRWEDRKVLSAQQAEDLVASLLQEHHGGQIVRLTANANAADGGIDLYLILGEDGAIRRAVQVKRRIESDVESVTEVRNFVGAMVLENIDRGIFVTTASRFSKVAEAIPKRAMQSKFKLDLELIDGERLFEILYATNIGRPAHFPPWVEPDQQWRDREGHAVSAFDLFAGEIARWSKFGRTPIGQPWPQG